jgi:hypothetical protein
LLGGVVSETVDLLHHWKFDEPAVKSFSDAKGTFLLRN